MRVGLDGSYEADSRGRVGEDPTTRERRLISLLMRSSGFVDQILSQCARGNPVKASTSVLVVSISGPVLGKLAASWSRTCSQAVSTDPASG